ncbi:MAG: hypothetical protein KDD25_00850 [Bdellovibrionales bacterium]|nr:hypothetical protein [Bdellovibrionales bacterium]
MIFKTTRIGLALRFFIVAIVVVFAQTSIAGRLDVEGRFTPNCAYDLKARKPSVRKLFRENHFVFVGGFTGDVFKSERYFKTPREAIDDLGGTSTRVFPPSVKPVPENIDFVIDAVQEAYRKFKKPMVLIGHSKGGAEVFASLSDRRMKSLVRRGIVKKVISVQGAIRGTDSAVEHLADLSLGFEGVRQFFTNPARSVVSTLFYRMNPFGFWIGRAEKFFFKNALLSMSPREMERFTNESGLCNQNLDGTLYYFSSSGNPFGRLGEYNGPSDGVIPVVCQYRTDVGQHLDLNGEYENADHLELFVAGRQEQPELVRRQKHFIIDLISSAFEID